MGILAHPGTGHNHVDRRRNGSSATACDGRICSQDLPLIIRMNRNTVSQNLIPGIDFGSYCRHGDADKRRHIDSCRT